MKPPSPRAAATVAIVGGVMLYVGLALSVLRYNAATFDEGSHLPAGYSYWVTGDYRLNPEHPPFIKMLAAAPLLALHPQLTTDDVAWKATRQWEFGRRFLYRWNDADRLLFWGRLPMVAISVVLIVALVLWTRRMAGAPAAGIVLLLSVLSPDLLAHGTLVTTDVGITLFTFLAVVAVERMREGVTSARIAAVCASFALATVTKFSVLLFVPILAILGLLLAARSASSRPRRVGAFLGIAALVAVGAYGALWACYRFRFTASPDGTPPLEWTNVVPHSALLRTAARASLDHHLLPEAFVLGFLRFFKASHDRPSFLFGRLTHEGHWYYFPATFLIKTPLPLIVLILAAVALALRGTWSDDRVRECFLWLPPLLYAAEVMTRSLNIGHRHLLPAYPYLLVLAGRAAAYAWTAGARAGRVLVAALLVWYAADTLRLHPHHLAYFNELVGGPSQGYKYLVDSNLDWGQDLKGLRAWMDGNGVSAIKLSYFGTAEPEYYGILCERPPGLARPAPPPESIGPGDLVAVSATNLGTVYMAGAAQEFMERFRTEKPVGSIGYSILLFRPQENYEVPTDAMGGLPPVACQTRSTGPREGPQR